MWLVFDMSRGDMWFRRCWRHGSIQCEDGPRPTPGASHMPGTVFLACSDVTRRDRSFDALRQRAGAVERLNPRCRR